MPTAKQLGTEPVPLQAPPPVRDRITMVMHIHHQHQGEQPHSVEGITEQWLQGTEQPYPRRTTVTDQWKPLDLGWLSVEDAGMLVVENLEGRNPQRRISKEEQAQIDLKVVEVGRGENDKELRLLCPPKGALPVSANSLAGLKIRCRSGSAQCMITVFPR